MEKKQIETQCPDCEGTGIFNNGPCERNSSGTICVTCDGTGKKIISYIPFTKRQIRTDIKRVFQSSFRFIIYSDDYPNYFENGKTAHFSKMGIPYQDWLEGKKPLPLKELVCPHEHSDQKWKWIPCQDLHRGCYSGCPHAKQMDKCWEEYEKNSSN